MTGYNRDMKGLTTPKWHKDYFKLRTSEQTAAAVETKQNKTKQKKSLNFPLMSKLCLSQNSAAINPSLREFSVREEPGLASGPAKELWDYIL